MSVRKRKWKDPEGATQERWYVDVQVTLPNGKLSERIRRTSPVQTRVGAKDYEMDVRRSLLGAACERREEAKPKNEAPTMRAFSEVYLGRHVAGDKPSVKQTKAMLFRAYINPGLGDLRLDEVKMEALKKFRSELLGRPLKPKTVNNVLMAVSKMLRCAVEDQKLAESALPKMPLFKAPRPPFGFFDLGESERLLAAALAESAQSYAAVLLALDTGMRQGEQIALEWTDFHLKSNEPFVTISRSDWRGQVGGTKNGETRTIPLTPRAVAALVEHRPHRGSRVFHQAGGEPWTQQVVKRMLPRLLKRAGVPVRGACCGGAKRTWHSLRHTFASHLVLKGVPLIAVQQLGGWKSLSMVERYGHIAPDHLRGAIRLLDPSCAIGNGTWGDAMKGGA
jgi:integrase